MRTLFVFGFLLAGLLSAARPAQAGAELLYFFSHGCEYCEQWDEEVGIVYGKTTDAKILPLRRINADNIPPDLAHFNNVHFTPTFIAIKDGREIGRLIGYMGADFFWQYLAPIVKKAETMMVRRAPEARPDITAKPRS